MISIITPVYNVSPYLRQFIDSVLSQTYRDFELVLVDDCSTDDSLSICEEYARKDGRIHALSQGRNGGPAKARNRGLDYVMEGGAEYVTFADSDDYLPPDALETLLRLIEECGADIAYGGFYLNQDGKISKKKFHGAKKRYSYDEALRAYLNVHTLHGYSVAKLYQRSILDGVRFPEDMHRCEDAVFSYFALTHAKKGVAFTSKPVYYYRIRMDSLSGYGQSIQQRDLDYLKEIQYVSMYTDMTKWRLDFMVFCFASHYRERKKYLSSDKKSKQAFKNEYQMMNEYCQKTWNMVFWHSINPRVKLMALQYGLFAKWDASLRKI